MPRKYTIDEILNKIREKHDNSIEVIDVSKIKNCQSIVEFKCKTCGYVWKTKPYSIIAGHGCRKCYDKRNSESRKIDFNLISSELDKNNIEIVGDYIDTKHNCKVKCKICGHEWNPIIRDLLNGHGCPICNDSWMNRRVSKEEFIEKMNKLYKNEYVYIIDKPYVTLRDEIEFICPIHGKIKQLVYTHVKGRGCKFCKESTLEKSIRFLLEENNIEFIPQHKAIWLNLMSYDFYIPKCNIAIECQGEQHFKPIEIFGGEEEFEKIKERDKNKKRLSKENNVELIYFLKEEYKDCLEDGDIFFTNKEEILDFILRRMEKLS